jgi:hypothetical protein
MHMEGNEALSLRGSLLLQPEMEPAKPTPRAQRKTMMLYGHSCHPLPLVYLRTKNVFDPQAPGLSLSLKNYKTFL